MNEYLNRWAKNLSWLILITLAGIFLFGLVKKAYADHDRVPVLKEKLMFHQGVCQVSDFVKDSKVITDQTKESNAYCVIFGEIGNNKTVFVAVMRRWNGHNTEFVVEVEFAEFQEDVWKTQKVVYRRGDIST